MDTQKMKCAFARAKRSGSLLSDQIKSAFERSVGANERLFTENLLFTKNTYITI